jgi:hypothetical protein
MDTREKGKNKGNEISKHLKDLRTSINPKITKNRKLVNKVFP